MNKAFGLVIFVAGAGIGSAVTWIFTKKKYSNLAKKEIDSVKEAFANRKEVFREQKNDIDDNSEQPTSQADKAAKALKKKSIMDYSSFSKYEALNEKYSTEKKLGKECPYVISPDEFGEFDDYEKISLTYYSDKVLTDDNDDIIEDVDEVVGIGSLDHFGEYEEDSVFVRNDQRMCDYEILLDTRTYSEAMKDEKPYLHLDEDDEDEDGEEE